MIADDPALAADIGAAGCTCRKAHARGGALARDFRLIITSSAHSLKALMGAHILDAVFLSPVFATASHKEKRPLTPVRAAFIAALSPVPVYALGGVTRAMRCGSRPLSAA